MQLFPGQLEILKPRDEHAPLLIQDGEDYSASLGNREQPFPSSLSSGGSFPFVEITKEGLWRPPPSVSEPTWGRAAKTSEPIQSFRQLGPSNNVPPRSAYIDDKPLQAQAELGLLVERVTLNFLPTWTYNALTGNLLYSLQAP